ncbi:MAG TPA: tetratricopeptide repeat protein [Micromonosporaceae bacterium]|nr:tetratricopeptide repeat protein [Micromonosporaceae bacterium]
MTVHDPGLARARALLIAHRPEEALRELATLPEAAATGPTAFGLRAIAFASLERWAESADAARAGLSAGGPDPDLLGHLGRALHELGDLPGAERALLDALAFAPTDAVLLCQYARLCMDSGQLPKAAELVRRAAADQPESAIVYATRVRLAYAMGKDREAQRISQEYLAAHPEDPGAHAALGGMSAVRGQTGPAYRQFRQATAASPDTPGYGEAAMELRLARHPVSWPIRPFLRYGVIKPWLAMLVVLFGLRAVGLTAIAAAVGLLWFALCVYSWIVPPLFRHFTLRRWRRTAP